MRLLYLFALGSTILFTACNASYSSASSSSDKEQAKEQQMLTDGYVKATVVLHNEASGCPVLLIFEDGEKLDPINLEESLAKDQSTLWVKFRRLRMPPRCDVASAISLTEAQKKAE